MPNLSNRDKRECQQPGDDAMARAAATVKRIRESSIESRLSAEVRASVLEALPHIRS